MKDTKMAVLNMLKELMMNEDGAKVKPMSVEVEVLKPMHPGEEPDGDEGSLADVLDAASDEDCDYEESDMPEEMEEEPKSTSLKDFFKRK